MGTQEWVGIFLFGLAAMVLCLVSAIAGSERTGWQRKNWLPPVLIAYLLLSTFGLSLLFGSIGEGIMSALMSLILAIPTALTASTPRRGPR